MDAQVSFRVIFRGTNILNAEYLLLLKNGKIRHQITHSQSVAGSLRRICWTNAFFGSSQTMEKNNNWLCSH